MLYDIIYWDLLIPASGQHSWATTGLLCRRKMLPRFSTSWFFSRLVEKMCKSTLITRNKMKIEHFSSAWICGNCTHLRGSFIDLLYLRKKLKSVFLIELFLLEKTERNMWWFPQRLVHGTWCFSLFLLFRRPRGVSLKWRMTWPNWMPAICWWQTTWS